MKEFRVGDHDYRAPKMGVLDQFDVARKWSPLLVWVSSRDPNLPPLDPVSFARGFCAVSTGVPKPDNDLVLGLCLSQVSRLMTGGAGWAPVRGADGQLRFDDIDLSCMLQIVYHVLQGNGIIDFFAEPRADQRSGAGA